MKFSLSLAVLILSLSCAAQTNGFWGVPFYSTLGEVKSIAAAKNAPEGEMADGIIFFHNVQFADEDVRYVAFDFKQDKMIAGYTRFRYDNAATLLTAYIKWYLQMTEKYGKPEEELNASEMNFKSVKAVESAIEKDKDRYSTFWHTTDKATGKKVTVNLWIEDKESMLISMTHEEPEGQKDKKKNSTDY